MRSFFRLLKNNSATALSQQFPQVRQRGIAAAYRKAQRDGDPVAGFPGMCGQQTVIDDVPS
jgi:hypothetical protein